MGLRHLVPRRPWQSVRLIRFLYVSSLAASVILLLLGVYDGASIWYLNNFGIGSPGTVLAADDPGWIIRYQVDAGISATSHVDWLPAGTRVGDGVEIRDSSYPWLLPQASGTPIVSALPIAAFRLVPVVAGIFYRQRLATVNRKDISSDASA